MSPVHRSATLVGGRVPRSLLLPLWRSLAGRRPSTASQPWAASTYIFEPALYLISSADGAGTAICSIYLLPGPSALRLRELFHHHHVMPYTVDKQSYALSSRRTNG